MNISLVIYCQHSQSLPKIHELTAAYAPFFSQCIILLNLPQNILIPSLYPLELKNVSILRMPDKIDAGAALNKFFPHLKCERVLLIDSRADIKKEILMILRHWADWELNLESCIVSFQSIVRCPQLHSAPRQGIEWRKSFRFVTTMNWGAIFFDHRFILGLGAFEAQLSEDALMVDLSWRAQQSTGLLVETIQPHALLKDFYEPTPLEWIVLNQKHPKYYPTWASFFKGIITKIVSPEKRLEKILN